MNSLKQILISILANLAFFFLTSSFLSAQLSGTKIIGTAPSDYTTFTAAVSALTSQGISSSVTFEVKPGTYNERITIGAISGVSGTKTILFRSQNLDSSSVILSYASSGSATNNFVVFLNNADYVNFSYMTIQRTGSSNYAQVIDISNGATHNSFQYCNIKGTSAILTNTFAALVGSTSLLEDSYNTFMNNTFEGGSYGLYFLGRGSTMLDLGLIISNNNFKHQNFKGIYITCQEDAQITGNTISTNSTDNNYYGIYGQYANSELRITKNKLALSTGYGIYLANCEGIGAYLILIANNFVAVAGSSANYGMYFNQLKYTNIYYNSVNLTTSTGGRAFYIGGAISQSNQVLNNIFAHAGGGYAIYLDPNTSVPLSGCNYNDLFTSGANLGYFQGSGNQTNLTNWNLASSFDANSISVNPNFLSISDLHVQNGALNGNGTPNLSSLTPVNDDIDGQTRNSLDPDIGADEFTIEDLGISSLSMDPSYCQFTTATIKIYIKNFSAFPFQGIIPVYYQIAGGNIVGANTGNLFIAGNDSTYYQFAVDAYLDSVGNIPIVCGTNLSLDINHANDLLNDNINVLPAPPANAGSDVYVCLGDSAEINATGGVSYIWNTVPPQYTSSIHVLENDTAEFIVIVTGLNGCSASDTVLVIPGIFPKPNADFTFVPFSLQVTFTDISTDATGWNWNFDDGNFSTDQYPVHNYAIDGIYDVTLIAYNGCDSDTIVKSITVIGMDEIDFSSLTSISPNPCNDFFIVSLPSNFIINHLNIIDITGKNVLSMMGSIPSKIDISSLSTGYYLVIMDSEAGFIRKKLLIQRK